MRRACAFGFEHPSMLDLEPRESLGMRSELPPRERRTERDCQRARRDQSATHRASALCLAHGRELELVLSLHERRLVRRLLCCFATHALDFGPADPVEPRLLLPAPSLLLDEPVALPGRDERLLLLPDPDPRLALGSLRARPP